MSRERGHGRPSPELQQELGEEELDPRVQDELEKLNSCTDEINRLETQLDDANTLFRSLLSDSTHHLKALSKKLGSCIERARPYYESVDQMNRAQAECQKAAVQFQRSAGIHLAAKETISLAEERFLDNSGEWQFDNAWQEMLNHATIKVMDAEKQRTASEKEHLEKSAAFTDIEHKVKTLEKKLSRHIEKSKPYFEQKEIFNKALNSEKARVGALQTKITETKAGYAQSLRNLEDISESIHARRKLTESRLETGTEFDSLTYDLSRAHLGPADSASDITSLSGGGRDSALGSTSLAGGSEAGDLLPGRSEAGDLLPGRSEAGDLLPGRPRVERSASLPGLQAPSPTHQPQHSQNTPDVSSIAEASGGIAL